MSVKGKGQDPAKAWFDHAAAGDIVKPRRTSPSNHDSYILHSVEQIRHRRSHDPGACVELPELFAVGSAVGAEHSVEAALEDEVARGREDSATLDLGKRNPPYLLLPCGIPGKQQSSHGGSRVVPGQEGAVVGVVLTTVPVVGVGDPTFVWYVQRKRALSRRQINQSGGGIERHRIPVVCSARGWGNKYRVKPVVRGCGLDRASGPRIDSGGPGDSFN